MLSDVPGPVSAQAPSVIRCEIGESYRDAARLLVHSIVHHRCEMDDLDVVTTDAIEAATSDVLERLEERSCRLTEVVLDTTYPGVDMALSFEFDDSPPRTAFDAGEIADAAFDEIVLSPDLIILRKRFLTGPQPW